MFPICEREWIIQQHEAIFWMQFALLFRRLANSELNRPPLPGEVTTHWWDIVDAR